MTPNFIDTDGGKLAFDVRGEGPLIICSPAMGDTRDAFDPVADSMVEQGYRVAQVDLRGHGDSAAYFNRYGDEAIADDFLTLLDALGGGPAVLVGASMSAAGAVIAAARRPERVTGVVLIAPFLRNRSGPVMRQVFRLALSLPWGPAVWRYSAAKLWPGLGKKAGQRAASSVDSLKRPGRWQAFQATASTDHRVVAPWTDRVSAPVLVIVGEADPDWKNPIAEGRWVASQFADAQTVNVADAGHAPMLERPTIVILALAKFLDRIGFGPKGTRVHNR